MRNNKLSFLLVLCLFLGIGLACSNAGEMKSLRADDATKNHKAEKLESYTLRGLKFSYYKVPGGLDKEKLIETAKAIRAEEPDAQLILVDDATGVADYINYAQQFSKGNMNATLPKAWADRHIVANVQKMMSGKWRLYESYGYKEIADLE
jgi:hypothetical protein